MKLYLISQNINLGYDTFDGAVVAAENEDDARTIHPGGRFYQDKWLSDKDWGSSWVTFNHINEINVEYLGETNEERGVVIASFNAG